ncbi:DUF4153 domain-containing protein [Psychroflexus aurantiacus]|uniref:DUF4153 domain-containing protein n=1 Tax=Psychroflexus aurantiacus TaxID=2709310 RepID=UPI00196744F1|nr:DUF4153 domain-containing protein [Psychroflexus aurantiacus]
MRNHLEERLFFLKFNADLIVMSGLLCIAGGILSGMTVGLFNFIGLDIENLYFEYIAIYGLATVPVLAAYLTQNNSNLVGRVSPVIARIFSPVVLVMLVIYLAAIFYAEKDPFSNREFLLIFNLLLIGVLAILFFSVSENSASKKSNLEYAVLFSLSLVTTIVNLIALLAILMRISEWGFTPNRLAVLGANVLFLIHLIWVGFGLFRVCIQKKKPELVEKSIAYYLPVYGIWAFIVSFLFPLIFG